MKTKADLVIPHPKEKPTSTFLERFFYLPKRGFSHENAAPIEWDQLFVKRAPLSMEICSGNGQWIAELAQKYPDRNWVAVELDFIRARKIWLKSFRYDLPNLFVVCAEANAFLTHYVKKQSVDEVFVNFPDPWPKRRHARHRLIQKPFAENLFQVLSKDGILTLATDDLPYKEQMERVFFDWEKILSDLDLQDYGDSFFASLWKEKGKQLYYLKYRKKYD